MADGFPKYVEKLNRGFAAVYALLERPELARRAIFLLLAIHTGLLAYSAYVHSPTLNEPGHLVAGLSHWKFSRFDVYNVNPPLVKMIAALPVMVVGYEEDWTGFSTGPGARPEFAMGEDFIDANGERSFFLFMIARWACIPLSWIGGVVCYLWATDLYSRPAGVIACSIWCFEPNILAHASLITPDAHATALGLAACYTFWRWLKKPTWSQAALTGVVLGLAELSKTTLILFYPLWPLLWLIYRWPERREMANRDWARQAGMLVVRMAIGLYVLNLGYGFEGSLKPIGEFLFVSDLFTDQEAAKKDVVNRTADGANHQESAENHLRNRFADTWLGVVPAPFPQNYLAGIDLQQRDFEHYGRPSYLRGEWRDRGWWYYYLYATAIKVPLGLWLLGGLALILRMCRCLDRPLRSHGDSRDDQQPSLLAVYRSPPTTTLRDELVLLVPPLMIFAVVSSKSGFSEHMRYVLPCFPFAFVWIAGSFDNFVDRLGREAVSCAGGVRRTMGRLATPLLWTLLLWSVASSLWIYPHSLSYFNESIGGPLRGPNHLLGSSVDWGQGLRYLRHWMDAHANKPNAPDCRLAYFGYYSPSRVGFADALPWEVDGADVGDGRRPRMASKEAVYAVSVNLLHGYPYAAKDGSNKPFRIPTIVSKTMRSSAPIHFAGYSIWIFEEPTHPSFDAHRSNPLDGPEKKQPWAVP